MTAPDLKTATYEEVLTYVKATVLAKSSHLIGKLFHPAHDLAVFEQILRGLADITSHGPIVCINGVSIDTRTIRFDPDSYALTVDVVPDPRGHRFLVRVAETTNKATVTPA